MLSTIGLIIDIVIVGALVITGIIGLKKGFLKSLISLFSWFVCLLIAIWVAKYVAGWINGIYNFSGLIGDNISKSLSSTNEYFNLTIVDAGGKENIINQIPEGTNGLLKQLIKVVFSNSTVADNSTETVANVMGSSLGQICMVIICAVLVFIVLKIAIALLSRLFDNIARTKIFGSLNKILGLALGILKAGLIIVALNCILVCLSLIPAVNKTITPLVQDNTHIEKVIYNQTDKIIGKYIIEGEVIQDWISNQYTTR